LITGGFSRIVEHNYLTNSRGKQGYDEEDIFTLMMVYASKYGIYERLNLWETLIKYKPYEKLKSN
jgi:hypothetical protein